MANLSKLPRADRRMFPLPLLLTGNPFNFRTHNLLKSLIGSSCSMSRYTLSSPPPIISDLSSRLEAFQAGYSNQQLTLSVDGVRSLLAYVRDLENDLTSLRVRYTKLQGNWRQLAVLIQTDLPAVRAESRRAREERDSALGENQKGTEAMQSCLELLRNYKRSAEAVPSDRNVEIADLRRENAELRSESSTLIGLLNETNTRVDRMDAVCRDVMADYRRLLEDNAKLKLRLEQINHPHAA
jgi:hypothetical protein